VRNYRKLVPIVAIILLAFGVNLDRFGINLEQLSGQGNGQSQQRFETGSGDSTDDRTSSGGSGLSLGNAGSAGGVDADLPHWSSSNPEINLWHVFHGEINRKGKPTGWHSRPGGQDPANARIVSIKDRPNRAGVYTATIEVRDGGQWKSKFSSFFPDNLSQQEVIDVIVHAYSNSKNPNKQPWSGPSGLGFQVQGYTSSRGGINTAFPVYNRNQ